MNYNSNHQTIDYDDTSIKKYPYNKYYPYNQLQNITKQIFPNQQPPQQPHSKTISYETIKNNHRKSIKNSCRSKPSVSFLDKKVKHKKTVNLSVQNIINSSKGASAAKLRSIKNKATITGQNYKQFSKQQIAHELSHYTKLCLNLRRQNLQLKQQKRMLKRQKRQNLIQIQQKLNKLNALKIQLKQKSLQQARLCLNNKIINKDKDKQNINSNNYNQGKYKRQGEFKRFFFQFMMTYGKIDEKLNTKLLAEKSLEKKLIIGHKLLKESSAFMRDKKYRFNCFFD